MREGRGPSAPRSSGPPPEDIFRKMNGKECATLLFCAQHYDIADSAIQAGMPMVVEGESVMRCSP